jgi:hypothetical protein
MSYTPLKKVDINSNASPPAHHPPDGPATDGYYACPSGFPSLRQKSILGRKYILNVDLALMDLIEHPLGHIGEELGDVRACFCRGREEGELRLGRAGGDRLEQV